jgi:hypothetical protein
MTAAADLVSLPCAPAARLDPPAAHPIQNGEPRIVNSIQMTTSSKQHHPALQSALRAARENESRWLAMQADYASDTEAMEQWASTAKLRRLEVERLEALLAEAERP